MGKGSRYKWVLPTFIISMVGGVVFGIITLIGTEREAQDYKREAELRFHRQDSVSNAMLRSVQQLEKHKLDSLSQLLSIKNSFNTEGNGNFQATQFGNNNTQNNKQYNSINPIRHFTSKDSLKIAGSIIFLSSHNPNLNPIIDVQTDDSSDGKVFASEVESFLWRHGISTGHTTLDISGPVIQQYKIFIDSSQKPKQIVIRIGSFGK